MNTPITVPTEQETVILRQLTVEDAPAYFAAVDANRDHLSQFGDETAAKYPDLQSVVNSIANPSNPDKIRMGIWDGETFVGSANLTPDEDGQATELGYWLDARHTGKGYATLATEALSKYALPKFHRVYAEVVEGNEASSRVLIRSGFSKTARKAGKLIFEFSRPELHSNPDFELQLDRAFADPKTITLKGKRGVSPEDLAHREQYHSPHASLPENLLIKSYENSPQDYEVSTEDPSLYPLLLAQAMRRLEITKGLSDPGLEITPQLEKVAQHEAAHGQMANSFGVGSRFGVRVLYDPNENIWALSPFHSLIGDYAGVIMLTRLQEAAIAIAPEDVSEADLHSAKALGYSNREEVLDRLYQAYPHLRPANL